MPWLDRVGAVLEAWYPGGEGGEALADVLTGAVNPSGRLPMTFPAAASQAPRPSPPGMGEPSGTLIDVSYMEGSDVGYRWYAAKGTKPLFAFGHGLSYSTFAYSDLHIAQHRGRLTAQFTVRNTGERAGADVPQLYLVEAAGRPARRLVGFAKPSLEPGATQLVNFEIDQRLLANWDVNGWRIKSGHYAFQIGRSAEELVGPKVVLHFRERRLAP
jgi:beta-glucosidase